MKINDTKVTPSSPFLTKEKWNVTAEYFEGHEKLFEKLLGPSYKGVYDPSIDYEIGDYIWQDGNCYIIKKINAVEFCEINVDNYKDFFKQDENFLAINSQGELVNLTKENSVLINKDYTYNKINYREGDNNVFASSGAKIINVDLTNKKTREFITLIDRGIVKSFTVDDFNIYVIPDKNNSILVFDKNNINETYVREFLNENEAFIDITSDSKNLYAISSLGIMKHFNKNTGIIEQTTDLTKLVKNAAKMKILAIDDYSMLFFNGTDEVYSLFKKINIYDVKGTIKSECIKNGINSMSISNGFISFGNQFGVTSTLASRYNYEEVDVKYLAACKNIIFSMPGIKFATDYSKGQLTSSIGERIRPKEYEKLAVLKNGEFKNSTQDILFLDNKGLKFSDSKKLVYDYLEVDNNTLIFKGRYTPDNVSDAHICTISTLLGKTIELKIKASNLANKEVGFTAFYNIAFNKEKDEVFGIAYDELGNVISKYTENSSSNQNLSNSISFFQKDNQNFIIKKVLIADIPNFSDEEMKVYSTSDFIIDTSYEEILTPFSLIKTDGNGNILLKRKDDSIKFDSEGYYVNRNNDLNIKGDEELFTTKGAYLLNDAISKNIKIIDKKVDDLFDKNSKDIKIIDEKIDNLSKKEHAHKYSSLLEFPKINGKELISSGITITSEDTGSFSVNGGVIKGKTLITQDPLLQNETPSITLALGNADTGFDVTKDGEVSFYNKKEKKYDLSKVAVNDTDVNFNSITSKNDVKAPKFIGNLNGKSDSSFKADKLENARKILLSGAVTGFINFDGSSNVEIITKVTNNSHSHTIDNVNGLKNELDSKASLNGAKFLGEVSAPSFMLNGFTITIG